MCPHFGAGLLHVHPSQSRPLPPGVNGDLLPDVLGVLESPPLDPGPLSDPGESLVVLPSVIAEPVEAGEELFEIVDHSHAQTAHMMISTERAVLIAHRWRPTKLV